MMLSSRAANPPGSGTRTHDSRKVIPGPGAPYCGGWWCLGCLALRLELLPFSAGRLGPNAVVGMRYLSRPCGFHGTQHKSIQWGRRLERSICAVRRTGNPAHGRHHVAEGGPSFGGGHSGPVQFHPITYPCQPMPHTPWAPPRAPPTRAPAPAFHSAPDAGCFEKRAGPSTLQGIAACRLSPIRPSPDHAFRDCIPSAPQTNPHPPT